MADLCRKTSSGPGAEVLANRGQKFLRYVENLPDFFGGNEMLNNAFKNAMANRTIKMADGSVLQTRRGPIGRVGANVPEPTLAGSPATATTGMFIGLMAYQNVYASEPSGWVLVNAEPFQDVVKYKDAAYESFWEPQTAEYFTPEKRYKDIYSAETITIPGVGVLRKLVGLFTTNDRLSFLQNTGSAEQTTTPTSVHIVNPIRTWVTPEGAPGEIVVPEELQEATFHLDNGATSDIVMSGRGLHTHQWYAAVVNGRLAVSSDPGFAPGAYLYREVIVDDVSGYQWFYRDSFAEPVWSPPTVGVMAYSGYTARTGQRLHRLGSSYGWVDAQRHGFGYMRIVESEGATIDQPLTSYVTSGYTSLVNHARGLVEGYGLVSHPLVGAYFPSGCGTLGDVFSYGGVSYFGSLVLPYWTGYISTDAYSTETQESIYVCDGVEYSLGVIDGAVWGASMNGNSYYAYPTEADTLAVFTLVKGAWYDDTLPGTFGIYRIAKGQIRHFTYALNQETYETTFPGAGKRIVWGDVQILVRLPEDNV